MKGSKGNKQNILEFEKIEMSNGISYEMNAIDFIKYSLCFSFLENEIASPEIVNLQFPNDLLEKAKVSNSNISKNSIKFDLVIKNMSNKEMKIFFNNLKKNIFQKQKLDLESKSNHNFDLLIEIAKNYFSQSQDKYSQISAYILLVQILNYLKDLNDNNENDETIKGYINLNKIICDKLKVNEHNEKVLIIVTNGSYHLLSQIIKFSNNNEFEDLEKKEINDKMIYSFDYNNKIDKILSELVKGTSISKVFSLTKNNGNIPNLKKFLNILSDLDKSKIKYSIIYFEDDIKISFENNILSEIKFQAKYNQTNLGKFHNNYEKIWKNIEEIDYTNIKNLSFKNEMNEFINNNRNRN